MKQKLKNGWKELCGNRGSGIAVVMMAMVLLTLMATTLLNMTYMSYKIKAEDRKRKEDYYTATAAMDEIRAGVQGVASGYIEEAYKDILVNRFGGVDENKRNFQGSFTDKFMNSGIDKNVLERMITVEGEFEVSLNDITIGTNIVFDNIVLIYKNSAGNKTTVKTDIAISLPNFDADWDYNELVQYRNWSIE